MGDSTLKEVAGLVGSSRYMQGNENFSGRGYTPPIPCHYQAWNRINRIDNLVYSDVNLGDFFVLLSIV